MKVKDGDKGEFTLQHGVYPDNYQPNPDSSGKPVERVVKGTVHRFIQDGETRWEIQTDNQQYPAIGFLPEHVLNKK